MSLQGQSRHFEDPNDARRQTGEPSIKHRIRARFDAVIRLANCPISAGQAIEGTVITAAAAAGWISWADLGSGTHTARAVASITRAGIW